MAVWTVLLLIAIWIPCLFFLKRYKIWIFYYLLGTIGFSYLLTYIFTKIINLELVLAHSVAISVHQFLKLFDIQTRIFENAPGVLLVLVVTQPVGWTVLQIGVESSGLLEMCVLVSLIIFYPGWRIWRKVALSLVGIGLTWTANIIRLLFIALMLHFFGKSALVLAHTFLGKVIFFVFTIGIYWLLITFPSLSSIRERIRGNHE